MTINDPAGYSEAAATVFTWLADKVLGGAKKALGWGWERGQWAAAQDRYDAQITKQYGSIRIFGQTTPKPLREVFTDVYMLDKPTAFSRYDPDALREHLWKQDRSVPFRVGERLPADQLLSRGSKFFILGKPGAGKTTFLKHLAVREAQRGKWGPCLGEIPIFVPLKQFAESGKPLFDFIVDQFAVCHFPDAAPFVEPLLKAGKALVLFDGLDEVTRAAEARDDRRGQVMQEIEQFSRQYDGCHIVVTCRIAATEYMFDPAFVYLELADFAPDQVDAFVRNWFWDPVEPEKSAGLAERMLAEWERPEHAGIRDLGRNPLLLTLLCLNYSETLSFPARRVEIYQEALEALLKKWDTSRGIQRGSLYGRLSLGRKQQMFSRIAYDGFVQDEILFSQADLEARLKAYLTHVPEVPDAVDIDAEAVLREVVEQHGIFAEQSRGLFSFAHLTFQEYYVAKFLAETLEPDSIPALMARVTDERWREVFLLTASLLPEATPFLIAFEAALHRLIDGQPHLVGWLRWIDEQAAVSQAGYSQSVARLWYACNLAVEDNLANGGPMRHGGIFDLVEARNRTGRLCLTSPAAVAAALAAASAGDLDVELRLDLSNVQKRDWLRPLLYDALGDFSSGSARFTSGSRDEGVLFKASVQHVDLGAILRRVREASRELGNLALDRELSDLEASQEGAAPAVRGQFLAQLTEIVETYGVLNRYRRLDAEADALLHTDETHPHPRLNDGNRFLNYLIATQLFFECLNLAYTPDRRAFEDRLLLPPPLTEQEA